MAEEMMAPTELEELRNRAARWEAMLRRISDDHAVEALTLLVARLEEQIARLEAETARSQETSQEL
jgi:predicted  nucleic acid-binding Zn-ribbon protein